MREKAIRFGKSTALVGVLTQPAGNGGGDLPGVVLLNSGILHRVGACRLHVKIARALAPAGYSSLRFDHGGIGDSEARRDTLPFAQAAPGEAREAMDYLAGRRGAERFILMGLCSGADVGFATAQEDERVVGLVQLDPYVYRDWKYHVHHYAQRVGHLDVWRNAVASRVARLLGAGARRPTAADLSPDYVLPEYRRRFPPRDEVAAGLRLLVERGVRQLTILTGGHQAHYNHLGQYRDVFSGVPFRELLDERFFPSADHIITGLDQQRTVLARIREWMVTHWPKEGERGSSTGYPAEGQSQVSAKAAR